MRLLFQKVTDFLKKKKSKQNSDQPIYNSQTNYVDYLHSYKIDNILTDDFYKNLIKTINWTEKIIKEINDATQINFTSILRKTNPVYKGKPFYCYTDTQSDFALTPQIPFNYSIILNEVLMLRKNNTLSFRDINQLGQIIEFDINLTTHDGAPCAESEGFVDESDIPPIDTWFYLTKINYTVGFRICLLKKCKEQ